jgi:hypothetical protein
VALYDELLVVAPSPVVELDRAIAVGMRDGPGAGLALFDAFLRGVVRPCGPTAAPNRGSTRTRIDPRMVDQREAALTMRSHGLPAVVGVPTGQAPTQVTPPRVPTCRSAGVGCELMFESGGAGGTASGAATDAATGTSLTAPLARAIDGLLDVDPQAASDHELAGAMVGLRREQARLAALVSELTAAFEARQVYAEDGSRSATDWIAVHARLPRPQVAGEVRDARRLRSMPETRAAFRAGDLSAAHVRVLARLAGHPRAGRHFPEGEAHLVGEGRRVRFDDWERLCAYWRDAADPDGPEQRHGRDRELRRFRVGVGLDGVGHPDGYLTSLATATLTEGLERIERELFDRDRAEARAIHGEATTIAHLARTNAQRRHDALVEMAVRAMTAPADGRRPDPLVTVMVDVDTLTGRVCELAAGTVIAPGAVAELLGQDRTLIQRVVFDGPNRLRDISSARTFRGILRRVLDVVHRRCEHGTCFVPAARCEGDHIVAWCDGGLTTQDNGRLGCGPHNRWWYQTGQSHPPPPDTDDDELDLELDDGLDAEVPAPGLHAVGRRNAPRMMLRIRVDPVPDFQVGDGAERCTIDLHPRRRHANNLWRDYPIGTAA